jgi:hypothetical protein
LSDEIKTRVVLASVLKPVDDTRMYEKIGATLVEAGFEVFIIGYPSTATSHISEITFVPLPTFNRISFKRLIIPWLVVRKINQVKPQTIIIDTPELLLVTVINKIFYGGKIVYDVLENYYRNIRYTNVYPAWIKFLLAGLVRLTENVFAPFVNRFFLAEKGYSHELGFVKNPVILENKFPQKIVERYSRKHSSYHNLLFSGTLAPITGVFEAIQWSKELHALNPQYNLTIIGYAALPEVLTEIREQIKDAPFIKLIGGDKLVPHDAILEEVSKAGTGIIIYPKNPGTESSIPTKLYEYLAFKLPVLIYHTEESNELVRRCNAGIVMQKDIRAEIVNEQLANSTFTFDCAENLFWESQSAALLEAIKQ